MIFASLIRNFLLIVAFISPFAASAHPEHEQKEVSNLVKAGNKYVSLLGSQLNVGDKALEFKVVNDSFTAVSLSDFKNKNVLISVVPSLDTGVCSLQTKRFNEEATDLSDDIVILTISNDLPFAQKRFCKNESIDKIKVLSDSVWRDFGQKYGLLIKDMGLLTRAIFIIDNNGVIAYKELVANLSKHPDYDQALATLNQLTAQQGTSEQNTEQNTATQKDTTPTSL